MDFLKNASIKTRLWVIMLTMALMVLFGGGVGLVGIAMTDNALEKTYTNSLEPTSMISRIMLLMDENRTHILLGLQLDPDSPHYKTANEGVTHTQIW